MYTGPSKEGGGKKFTAWMKFVNPTIGGNSASATIFEEDPTFTIFGLPGAKESPTTDITSMFTNGNKCRMQYVITPEASDIAAAEAKLEGTTQVAGGVVHTGPSKPPAEPRPRPWFFRYPGAVPTRRTLLEERPGAMPLNG
jgi:hypothetical protein